MKDKLYRNKEWLQEQFKEYKTPSLVSTMTGYPRTCITRYAVKYDIYNSKYTREKTNYVNEDYFCNIDSPDKAYFLGFIMADGNMYKRKNGTYQFSIKIKNTDKDILFKFADAIGFNKEKIHERSENRNGTITHCTEIKIYNQRFCNSLIALGIIPRKTGKEYMPEMPDEFKKDFIRGYIDGDGWIGKDKALIGICSSSNKILEQINEYLKETINTKLNSNKRRKDNVYVNSTANRKKVYHILKHLYYEDCISLDRKNNLAKKSIENIYEDLIGSL